jgi:hypothetical protein
MRWLSVGFVVALMSLWWRIASLEVGCSACRIAPCSLPSDFRFQLSFAICHLPLTFGTFADNALAGKM